MSNWRYGAKMSATRIFLAPVRKKPAPEIRLGPAPPASNVGKVRPTLLCSRVYYYKKKINIKFLLVKRRRVHVVGEHYSTCIIINFMRISLLSSLPLKFQTKTLFFFPSCCKSTIRLIMNK